MNGDNDTPGDFREALYLFRTVSGTQIEGPKDYQDRNENGTGLPHWYYIRGRYLGFDVTLSEDLSVTFLYKGLGTDVTEDADPVLANMNVMDDDPFWDGIVFDFAFAYFRRKYYKTRDPVDREQRDYYFKLAAVSRNNGRIRINSFNSDMAMQSKLPSMFRGYTGSGDYVQRRRNEGDIIRVL
jgi:hypothetical protein